MRIRYSQKLQDAAESWLQNWWKEFDAIASSMGIPPTIHRGTATATPDEDPYQRLVRLIRWPAQRLAQQVRSKQ